MCRSLPFSVVVAIAWTAQLAKGTDSGPPASNTKKKTEAFPSRVLALTDLVLKRHIDPPTRQQMILHGTRALYRMARKPIPQGVSRRISKLASTRRLTEFLNEVRSEFSKKPQQSESAFIDGMLSAVPGGVRLISAENRKVQGQLNANRYVGTGIVLRTDRATRRAAIRKPFYNGPAWKAGAKSGDIILNIDGKDTAKMSLQQVVRLLRGKKGTVVEMLVRQPQAKKPRTLKVTRDVAFIPTVEGHRQISAGKWQYHVDSARHLAYVRINRIGSSTLHELRQVERHIRGKRIRGIILDLRFGGGTLHDIVMIADALLDDGIIGRVRTGDSVKIYKSVCSAMFSNLRMTVLVDRYTSGGREFLAAALQDNRRATVVGEPTRGDGVVRSIIQVPDRDHSIIMATGELQRGDGTPLRAYRQLSGFRVPRRGRTWKNRPGGIVPDHFVTIKESRRAALSQAYSYTTPGLRKPVEDPLLAKAVKVLNMKVNRVGSKSKTSKTPGET